MNQYDVRQEYICLSDHLAHQDQNLNNTTQEWARLWYVTRIAQANEVLGHTTISASDDVELDQM